jgi:hypothetical protein
MAEDKAGKATAKTTATMITVPYNVVCPECRLYLYMEWQGKQLVACHADSNVRECPNAGKRFKVATVELEELK